ncbi:hypothetical protein Tco_0087550 [Tanacetum coccineum]
MIYSGSATKLLFALLHSPSTQLESFLHYVNKLPLGRENRTVETLKKGSPFAPDSEPPLRPYQLWKKARYEDALRKSDQMHQTFKKSSLAMTHKLDDMIELLESQPKETYIEDLECSLGMMNNEEGNTSPQSTPQIPPSFEEYTSPMTYPKEVEETLGTPMEDEPFEQMKLEDLDVNTCSHDLFISSREVSSVDEPEPQLLPNFPSLDVNLEEKRGTDPPINPYSPGSFRMKVVEHLIIYTPPSSYVAAFHPKDIYCYYHPCVDDPKKHYGFKPGLLGSLTKSFSDSKSKKGVSVMLAKSNQDSTLKSDSHGAVQNYEGVNMEATKSILEEISSGKYNEVVDGMSLRGVGPQGNDPAGGSILTPNNASRNTTHASGQSWSGNKGNDGGNGNVSIMDTGTLFGSTGIHTEVTGSPSIPNDFGSCTITGTNVRGNNVTDGTTKMATGSFTSTKYHVDTSAMNPIGATGASSSESKNAKAKFRSLVSENVYDGVELTIPRKVLEKVFLEDGITLIATQLESVIMGISLFDGSGFSKEMVRVEYDWKPPRLISKRNSGKTCYYKVNPSNVIVGKAIWQPIKQKVRYEPRATGSKSTSSKDCQNTVHTVSNKQPPKAADIPSSLKTSYTVKNEGTKFPTSSSTIPTYNPYDLLARESDPENSTRSGDDLIQDDMESE